MRRTAAMTSANLGVLWRTLVFVFGCMFLIPIPWVMRWYTSWYVSQFELVDRAV